ncbi:MAG: methyltransferase [Micavibrio sp.]|nr:methyltransferase [Micavibrio sp.]
MSDLTYDALMDTTLLNGRVKLLQPKIGFHASIDTVFLAAAVPLKKGMQLLDVGCGVGSAGLCVLARAADMSLHGISLSGLDAQEDLVNIASRNAALNHDAKHSSFFAGNLLHEKLLPDNAFDTVMMNPPYQEAGTHTPSPEKIKAMSHGEDASGAALTDWVKYAHRKLTSGGALIMIHRADRLDDIIAALVGRRWFGSLVVQPLMSRTGDDAKRVIVTARKERYSPMMLKSGFIIHEADGSYTAAAKAVLMDAQAIDLSR